MVDGKGVPGVGDSCAAGLRFFLFPKTSNTNFPQSTEEVKVSSRNKYFGAEPKDHGLR